MNVDEVRSTKVIELRIAFEEYKNEIEQNLNNLDLPSMTPELTAKVKYKYKELKHTVIIDLTEIDHIAEYIEKSTIYSQSLQLKCNE